MEHAQLQTRMYPIFYLRQKLISASLDCGKARHSVISERLALIVSKFAVDLSIKYDRFRLLFLFSIFMSGEYWDPLIERNKWLVLHPD